MTPILVFTSDLLLEELHESIDLDELYPMVLVAPRVSHSFDFSRGVEIFAAPRDVHPYSAGRASLGHDRAAPNSSLVT